MSELKTIRKTQNVMAFDIVLITAKLWLKIANISLITMIRMTVISVQSSNTSTDVIGCSNTQCIWIMSIKPIPTIQIMYVLHTNH